MVRAMRGRRDDEDLHARNTACGAIQIIQVVQQRLDIRRPLRANSQIRERQHRDDVARGLLHLVHDADVSTAGASVALRGPGLGAGHGTSVCRSDNEKVPDGVKKYPHRQSAGLRSANARVSDLGIELAWSSLLDSSHLLDRRRAIDF